MQVRLNPLQIGSERLEMPIILAPMAGVTDLPFRQIVRKFGAGMVVSEMISCQAMVRSAAKTLQMASSAVDDLLPVVQIVGGDPAVMAQAARQNADLGARIIDLNFGCPAKKIVNGIAGSALMRDELLAARIMEAVVKAVDVPITLKMRLGWNYETLNAPRLAKIAEESGIRMITVHGRTRCQFYEGKANWELIRAVKDATRLPLIVNGDIHDAASACEALAQSGADGLMIGRATMGRPWLLKQIIDFFATGHEETKVPVRLVYESLCAHFENMLSYYGARAGLRIARKHLSWYSKGLPRSAEFRSAVNQLEEVVAVKSLIDAFFQPHLDEVV